MSDTHHNSVASIMYEEKFNKERKELKRFLGIAVELKSKTETKHSKTQIFVGKYHRVGRL